MQQPPLQRYQLRRRVVVNGRYKVLVNYFHWQDSDVYIALDTSTDTEVLVKIYPNPPVIDEAPVQPNANENLPIEVVADDNDGNRRSRELEYLEVCKPFPGFPRVVECLQLGNNEALVFTRFGAALKHILFQNISQFSMRNTVRFGWQLFKLIDEVHESGYLHRGLCPSTIMAGVDWDGRYKLQLSGFDYTKKMQPPPPSIGMANMIYHSLQVNEGTAYDKLDDYMSILIILMETQNNRPFNNLPGTMIERKREFEDRAYDWMRHGQDWMADLHTVILDQRTSGFNKKNILKCLTDAIPGFDPRSPIIYRWMPDAVREYINLNQAESDDESDSDDEVQPIHRIPIVVPHNQGNRM